LSLSRTFGYGRRRSRPPQSGNRAYPPSSGI